MGSPLLKFHSHLARAAASPLRMLRLRFRPTFWFARAALNSRDQEPAARGVGSEMERSGPQRGLLEVQGRHRGAVRQLQEPARWIIGEHGSGSGEVVEVDRVTSPEILE